MTVGDNRLTNSISAWIRDDKQKVAHKNEDVGINTGKK